MTDAELIAKAKADLTWVQKHERILLALVAGVVLWFSIGKIDTLIANHDHAALQQAEVVAAAQADKNLVLANAAQQAAAQYQALAEKVAAQNAALEQANVNLAAALTKQQKTDATLPPSELIVRWAQLVPNAEVSILTNGMIGVPQSTAVATVQQLEEVPVLRTQNANIITQNANLQSELDSSRTQVGTLDEQITGLKLQIMDNDKVCKAQIAVVKADARKAKRKWLIIGSIGTIAIRAAIKIGLGI